MRWRSFNLVARARIVLILAAITPNLASADSDLLSILPEKPIQRVVEGENGIIRWDITNISGLTLTLTPGGPGNKFLEGDEMDVPKSSKLTGSCVPNIKLGPGDKCTLFVEFTTKPNHGGDDFGKTDPNVVISIKDHGFQHARGVIIIKDSEETVVTPEPSSLLLLGTGLVCLVPVIRRTLRL